MYTPSFLSLIPTEAREKRWLSLKTWWGQENSTIPTSYFHAWAISSSSYKHTSKPPLHVCIIKEHPDLSPFPVLTVTFCCNRKTQHLTTTKKHSSSTALLAEGAIWCFKVYKISTKLPRTWEGKGHPTPKRHILSDLKLLSSNSNPEIMLHCMFL